ncbi:MAG: hypothetical protein IJE89_03200 [Bacilli bacterium]|nr:hypothetical protein [Bacilli bacterium]
MKKLSFQKIFCFISFLFILSCCIFYGTRFIKLYLENKEEQKIEKNSLVKVIRKNNENKDNFKEINGSEYFINDSDNNYLIYSNILWRIIKINDDNSLTVISEEALTSLAYGVNLTYENSYINKWLNNTDDEYSGILESNLNEVKTYLQKTNTCLDIVNEVDNKDCENVLKDNYISLLSTTDYANIGNKKSYVNNNEYFYLNNTNNENEVWYITDDGKLSTSKGTDIIGVKPVITIKSNIDYIKGDGTKDDPYTIEKEIGLFGSYVKLDNQLWRIYQVNETEVRLVLNDYLKVNNANLEYRYSNTNSYHNDTKYGSIAYYLNHDFLNKLSYKDKIKEVKWSNGYYGSESNYDYQSALDKTIDSKVALISIGDIIINNDLENYATLTGTSNKGSMIYTIRNNKKVYTKSVVSENYVVPTISIDTNLLIKGTGTYDSPLEME